MSGEGVPGNQAAPGAGSRPRASGIVAGMPAIVIVSRDDAARQNLHRELAKRYGADYQIVVCGEPTELAAAIRKVQDAGEQVALIIGGIGGQDPEGIDTLATVRPVDATALRVAAFYYGDFAYVEPLFEAIAQGKVDHWVPLPESERDEEFHRAVTEFLSEWNTGDFGGFEALRLIGEQWSPRSQELRDTFSRNRPP